MGGVNPAPPPEEAPVLSFLFWAHRPLERHKSLRSDFLKDTVVLQSVMTYACIVLCNKECTGYKLITSTVTAVRSGADVGRRDAVIRNRGDGSSESSCQLDSGESSRQWADKAANLDRKESQCARRKPVRERQPCGNSVSMSCLCAPAAARRRRLAQSAVRRCVW